MFNRELATTCIAATTKFARRKPHPPLLPMPTLAAFDQSRDATNWHRESTKAKQAVKVRLKKWREDGFITLTQRNCGSNLPRLQNGAAVTRRAGNRIGPSIFDARWITLDQQCNVEIIQKRIPHHEIRRRIHRFNTRRNIAATSFIALMGVFVGAIEVKCCTDKKRLTTLGSGLVGGSGITMRMTALPFVLMC